MADKSKIEWTESTWNPIVGCTVVSPGCTNCYAMKMAARLQKMNRTGGSGSAYVNPYDGTTIDTKAGAVWSGKVALAPEHILTIPLRRKKPTTYFVNSMGDVFHESVPDEWIDKVFAVMTMAPQHTFQVLTKRADRMRAYLADRDAVYTRVYSTIFHDPSLAKARFNADAVVANMTSWLVKDGFLPNVWLGVSAEDQTRADERIPHLLATPAAVRFVSAEPLLGPVDFTPQADETYQRLSEWYGPNGFDPTGSQPRRERMHGYFPRLDWVIVGGESGADARPMHPAWARSIRDQCTDAGVPFFFKQWGVWGPDEAAKAARPADDPMGMRWNVRHVAGPTEATMHLLGKKAAGRLLDGIEHNAMPEARP